MDDAACLAPRVEFREAQDDFARPQVKDPGVGEQTDDVAITERHHCADGFGHIDLRHEGARIQVQHNQRSGPDETGLGAVFLVRERLF